MLLGMSLRESFTIHDRTLTPPLILSPMAGVTDSPFRQIIKKCGDVGLIVTEFISVEGLTRGNMRSHQMMRFREIERPLAIQIFGYDEVRMRWAAEIAEEAGADFVDINCGCPAKKVVHGGGGSNLLRDLPQLRKILTEVKSAISIPMTVKIRAGWDENSINAVETARLIEDCGASMVTLHGRTRVQGYRGLADWDLVQSIKQAVSIPVSGSGDIITPADVIERFERTGCDAVHIGRTAIANPYIFRQTWDVLNGREMYQPSPREMHLLLLEYLEKLREDLPERAVIGRLKMLSAQFLKGVPNAAPLRTAALRAATVEQMLDAIAEYFALAEEFGIDIDLQVTRDASAEMMECGV